MTCFTPKWMGQVVGDLRRHEGFREFAYPDPLSKLGTTQRRLSWGKVPAESLLKKYNLNWKDGLPWTVGYGFTKSVTPATSINEYAARKLLEQIIIDHLPVLNKVVPDWEKLPLFAQSVVINMAFNMGSRLLQFKNSMGLINDGKFDQAAKNLRKSLWAKQVGARAQELITRLERRAIDPKHKVV